MAVISMAKAKKGAHFVYSKAKVAVENFNNNSMQLKWSILFGGKEIGNTFLFCILSAQIVPNSENERCFSLNLHYTYNLLICNMLFYDIFCNFADIIPKK